MVNVLAQHLLCQRQHFGVRLGTGRFVDRVREHRSNEHPPPSVLGCHSLANVWSSSVLPEGVTSHQVLQLCQRHFVKANMCELCFPRAREKWFVCEKCRRVLPGSPAIVATVRCGPVRSWAFCGHACWASWLARG
jgi:hypothetical protein